MRLRVKSDGTQKGIWVEDENGNRIEHVIDIELRAGVDSLPRAEISFWIYPEDPEAVEPGDGKVVDATSLECAHRTWVKLPDCSKASKPVASSWIPVKNRLPELYGRYLVLMGASVEISRFDAANDNFVDALSPVTHWMPIPELPILEAPLKPGVIVKDTKA
jgi:hypothetical protein